MNHSLGARKERESKGRKRESDREKVQQEAEEEEEAVQGGTPLNFLALSAEAGGRSLGSPGDPGPSPAETPALPPPSLLLIPPG